MKALIPKFKGWERSGNKACWLPPDAGNQQKGDVCFHIRAAQALLSKEAWKEGVPPKPEKVWHLHIWSIVSHGGICSSTAQQWFVISDEAKVPAGSQTLFSLCDTPTGLLANGETNRRRWLRPSWCGEYRSTYVWLQRQHGRGCATMLLCSITFSMLG